MEKEREYGEGVTTKAELVEKVATQVNLTKQDTEVVIDTILAGIAQTLASTETPKVELRGFGSFRIRQRRARQGRNPQRGTPVDVPAERIAYFKPSKELKAWADA